jgi:dolichyl-phosphate-mannose-protein mannosyltransferase
VSMLREALGRRAGDGDPAQPGTRARRAAGRLWSALAGLPGLAGRHRLFCVVLGLAVVPRIIVMLGFRPAILFKLDSYDYLWDAAHLRPNPVNPSGYTVFLWLLKPFHSLALIAGLQHLLGLTAAVLVYAVLRRLGVRAWIATLACVPVLFDPAQFLIEQLVMADLLAMVLMIAGFAVLLLARGRPSLPQCAAAGLLMGASAVVRPTTLPLVVFVAVYLLARRAGWRRAVMALAAGALPVLAYMSWFAAVYGSFNLTNSNGLFLWSRTMSFANCATIKPPPDLAALCPDRQPGALAQPVASKRLLPKQYLWDHQTWMWTSHTAPGGIVPDTGAFTSFNNQRALRFAIRAIEAQPLGYARVVAHDVSKPFKSLDIFPFPGPAQPSISTLGPKNRPYALAAVRAYVGSTAGIGPYLGHHLGTRLVQPYSHLIRAYQRFVRLPGPLFALVVLAGLAGIVIPRRRTAAAVLLWTSALVTVVLPIAEHEYTYRYVIPAVPLACMAAALAVASRRRQALPADALPADALPADAGPADAGPADTGPEDALPADTGPADTGPADALPADTRPADTGPAADPCQPGPAAETGTGTDAGTDPGAGTGAAAGAPAEPDAARGAADVRPGSSGSAGPP